MPANDKESRPVFGSVYRLGRDDPHYQADRVDKFCKFSAHMIDACSRQLREQQRQGRKIWDAKRWLQEQNQQLQQALQESKKVADEPRHVSGQTLCDGLRQFAIERWGRLAMLVLGSWNVHTTRDFGEIVYLLIANKWMSAQPSDDIDHFNDVYDFKTVFKDHFRFAG